MNDLLDGGGRLVELVRQREETLELLAETGRQKPWLVEELGVSRSTVDRAIAELTRVGLVCRVPEGYRTTTLGRSLLVSYRALRRDAVRATEVEGVGETPGALRLPTAVLAAMEPIRRSPTQAIGQVAGGADSLCVSVDSVDPTGTFQLCHDLCVERGVSLTLIVGRCSLSALRDRQAEKLRRMALVDDCRLFAGEVPDDGLWIVRRGTNRQVVVTLTAGDGESVTTLTADDRRVCRWAEETFADHAIAACEVTGLLRSGGSAGRNCRV